MTMNGPTHIHPTSPAAAQFVNAAAASTDVHDFFSVHDWARTVITRAGELWQQAMEAGEWRYEPEKESV